MPSGNAERVINPLTGNSVRTDYMDNIYRAAYLERHITVEETPTYWNNRDFLRGLQSWAARNNRPELRGVTARINQLSYWTAHQSTEDPEEHTEPSNTVEETGEDQQDDGLCHWCDENDSEWLSEGEVLEIDGTPSCQECHEYYTETCGSCSVETHSDNVKPYYTIADSSRLTTIFTQNLCRNCGEALQDATPIINGYIQKFDNLETFVEVVDPIRNSTITFPAESFNTLVTAAERVDRFRLSHDRIRVRLKHNNRQGEADNMPEYRRMNKDGTCQYMCGNNWEDSPGQAMNTCSECRPRYMCVECQEGGVPRCVRCLTTAKDTVEKLETTLRPQRIAPRNYHAGVHREFKAMKYRLPGERPYLYYGIEIEVELPHEVERDAFAETICLEAEGLFVAERDASLRNGVEFISRPVSYAAWKSEKIQKILEKVYTAFEAFGVFTVSQNNAGMHIHMSKKFFQKSKTKTVEQQKEDLAWIFEYYADDIAKLSRRKLNQFCTSKKMIIQRQMRNMSIMATNYKVMFGKEAPVQSRGHGETHHHMISETGQTFEVRTFACPESVNHVYAALEMCRNLAHFARNYKLEKMNLGQIIHMKSSPELDKYLKDIKVNPYETEEIKDEIQVSNQDNPQRYHEVEF